MKEVTSEFKYSKTERIWRIIFTILITLYCCITIYMLVMTISNSFKTKTDLLNNTFGLPKSLSLESYKYVITHDSYFRKFLNSLLITISSVAGTIILGATTAYGISRYKFKYADALLSYFLVGMMLPIQLKLIPMYTMLKNMHIINTFPGLILIYISSLSLPVFIFSTFFKNLPQELYEAATIDGAGEFRIFYEVMIPLAKPILSSVALLTFFANWNDFFLPLVFLAGKTKMTLPLLINNYTSTLLQSWGYLFAAVTLSILPIIIIFIKFSEKIVSGISDGAVKG